MASPSREGTPASGFQPKQSLEHNAPAVSSPLHSQFGQQPDEPSARVARIKKDSQKKREAEGRQSEPTKYVAPVDKGFQAQRFVLAQLRPKDFSAHHPPTLVPSAATFSDKTPVEYEDNSGARIIFNEQAEYVRNQKVYRYYPAVADPSFPHSYFYRKSETGPYYARFEYQDMGSATLIDDSGLKLAGTAGWRSARANVCAKFGTFYHEIKVICGMTPENRNTTSGPHVRIGFARKEAPLEANVGFDCYSYGITDKNGQALWKSSPSGFFPNGESIEQGDVIGLEITLPSEKLHRKVVDGHYNPAVDLLDDWSRERSTADIMRDRIPIRFRGNVYHEHEEYVVSEALKKLASPWVGGVHKDAPMPNHELPEFRTLPGSFIKVYKNGVPMGTAFKDLLAFLPPASKSQNSAPVAAAKRDTLDDGGLGYYPTVSLFYGAAIEANFGPNFWYPPPNLHEDGDVNMAGSEQLTASADGTVPPPIKPISDRYNDQICEDIVAEILDEVDFMYNLDNGVVPNHTKKIVGAQVSDTHAAVLEDAGSLDAEMKELVQDD